MVAARIAGADREALRHGNLGGRVRVVAAANGPAGCYTQRELPIGEASATCMQPRCARGTRAPSEKTRLRTSGSSSRRIVGVYAIDIDFSFCSFSRFSR